MIYSPVGSAARPPTVFSQALTSACFCCLLALMLVVCSLPTSLSAPVERYSDRLIPPPGAANLSGAQPPPNTNQTRCKLNLTELDIGKQQYQLLLHHTEHLSQHQSVNDHHQHQCEYLLPAPGPKLLILVNLSRIREPSENSHTDHVINSSSSSASSAGLVLGTVAAAGPEAEDHEQDVGAPGGVGLRPHSTASGGGGSTVMRAGGHGTTRLHQPPEGDARTTPLQNHDHNNLADITPRGSPSSHAWREESAADAEVTLTATPTSIRDAQPEVSSADPLNISHRDIGSSFIQPQTQPWLGSTPEPLPPTSSSSSPTPQTHVLSGQRFDIHKPLVKHSQTVSNSTSKDTPATEQSSSTTKSFIELDSTTTFSPASTSSSSSSESLSSEKVVKDDRVPPPAVSADSVVQAESSAAPGDCILRLIIEESSAGHSSGDSNNTSGHRPQPQVICWQGTAPLLYRYSAPVNITSLWSYDATSGFSLQFSFQKLEEVDCHFQCGTALHLCLLKEQLCDGHSDCPDNSDEAPHICHHNNLGQGHSTDSDKSVKALSTILTGVILPCAFIVVVSIVVILLMIRHKQASPAARRTGDALLASETRHSSEASRSSQDTSQTDALLPERPPPYSQIPQAQDQSYYHLYQQQQHPLTSRVGGSHGEQQQEQYSSSIHPPQYHFSNNNNKPADALVLVDSMGNNGCAAGSFCLPRQQQQQQKCIVNSGQTMPFSAHTTTTSTRGGGESPHHQLCSGNNNDVDIHKQHQPLQVALHPPHQYHHPHPYPHNNQQPQLQRGQKARHVQPSVSPPPQSSSSSSSSQSTAKHHQISAAPSLSSPMHHPTASSSCPPHIAVSLDGEEGYVAAQRSLLLSRQLEEVGPFRAPPNRSALDRDSPPPPYSVRPPGVTGVTGGLSLDSLLSTCQTGLGGRPRGQSRGGNSAPYTCASSTSHRGH